MPIMKPPENASNPTYGCVYVDGSIWVNDPDVEPLRDEGWTIVVDEDEADELGVEVSENGS